MLLRIIGSGGTGDDEIAAIAPNEPLEQPAMYEAALHAAHRGAHSLDSEGPGARTKVPLDSGCPGVPPRRMPRAGRSLTEDR